MRRPPLIAALAAVVIMATGALVSSMATSHEPDTDAPRTTARSTPSDAPVAGRGPAGAPGRSGVTVDDLQGSASTVTIAYPDGQRAATPPSTIPVEAMVFNPPGCDPTTPGDEVTMKLWGDTDSGVWLPYAVGWPTNQPGEAIDCAPNTALGAVVAAVHAMYIDALAPAWIPAVALDTPGRDARLASHEGTADPEGLGFVCEPEGWAKPDPVPVYWIFHSCDHNPVVMTRITMDWRDDRWQAIYTIGGVIGPTEPAAPGTTYHPFRSGD